MLTLLLMLLKHSPIQTAFQPEYHVPPWIQPWLANQRSSAWFQCTPLKSACFQPTPEQSDNGCRCAWCDRATQGSLQSSELPGCLQPGSFLKL